MSDIASSCLHNQQDLAAAGTAKALVFCQGTITIQLAS